MVVDGFDDVRARERKERPSIDDNHGDSCAVWVFLFKLLETIFLLLPRCFLQLMRSDNLCRYRKTFETCQLLLMSIMANRL